MSSEKPDPVGRAEDDDYDVLTYGEVVARISEVLAEEQRLLQQLRAATPPDERAIAVQQTRIDTLLAGRERYERQHETAEVFMKRFGLAPRAPRAVEAPDEAETESAQ
jgi:hypothetical protein